MQQKREGQVFVWLLQETGLGRKRRRRGVWRNREEGEEFSEHGNGPKGKHSSDSRCENTLYTLTHTYKEHEGKLEVMRVIKKLSWRVVIGWFVTLVTTFFWPAWLSTRDKPKRTRQMRQTESLSVLTKKKKNHFVGE